MKIKRNVKAGRLGEGRLARETAKLVMEKNPKFKEWLVRRKGFYTVKTAAEDWGKMIREGKERKLRQESSIYYKYRYYWRNPEQFREKAIKGIKEYRDLAIETGIMEAGAVALADKLSEMGYNKTATAVMFLGPVWFTLRKKQIERKKRMEEIEELEKAIEQGIEKGMEAAMRRRKEDMVIEAYTGFPSPIEISSKYSRPLPKDRYLVIRNGDAAKIADNYVVELYEGARTLNMELQRKLEEEKKKKQAEELREISKGGVFRRKATRRLLKILNGINPEHTRTAVAYARWISREGRAILEDERLKASLSKKERKRLEKVVKVSESIAKEAEKAGIRLSEEDLKHKPIGIGTIIQSEITDGILKSRGPAALLLMLEFKAGALKSKKARPFLESLHKIKQS
ncbi:hypothetical protein DRN74_03325 [Candidatus Micrarchaeota archaeon]|nr:MAG: hypothetical protein DRN74_03325 [Candidatus Micrarchaeota archaeon]